MFKPTLLGRSLALAFGGAVALTAVPAAAQTTIEITGSRIKRADSEGALPITTFSRAELEASGSATVAEFIRNISFSTDGQFRPQSGSSAQGFSGVSLRGLGSQRTLVLVDGRRVAKSPNVGDSADMNSIPFAAVERIEILTDGASAVYGSDAIGGVVNVILRKDFDGVSVSYEKTNPSITGGDRESASALFGLNTDKGRMVAGVSKTSRDIIYVRDYPWGYTPGASSFSNQFFNAVEVEPGVYVRGSFRGNAGTCNFPDKGFYVTGGRCRYDFNLVAADEAETSTTSIFARGEYRIAKDWSAYLVASNTRNRSFGRYAPVPDDILIQPSSPANTIGATAPLLLGHRFAAAGNRDTYTDGDLYDMNVGIQGSVGGFDVEFGVRRTTSKIIETGRGFIVKEIATRLINDGTYNVADPFSNPAAILTSLTTTTGRDSVFAQTEVYANAQMNLFKLPGGTARLYFGAEQRKEDYKDIYDALSESGQVLGSSGNSAQGGRKVQALTTELLFPLAKGLEATLAARYEDYSDYGTDFSPKASIRFQPMSNLTLRGSVGKGFAAPSLPILTQKPSFSADSVIDLRNCIADGGFPAEDCASEPLQINGLRIANPSLSSEKSTQFSFGGIWDATPNLSIKADYWNIKVDDVISFISAQTIVNRDNGDDPLSIPAGLSITRDPTTGAIQRIVSGSANEGTLKFAGIDASVLFSHKYPALGTFRHELVWSHRLTAKVNDVDFNGTWGQPKDRITLTNKWNLGAFDASLNVNYIGKNGGTDEDMPLSPSYTTLDLQFGWKPPVKGAKLTVGVVNATEKFPTRNGSPYDSKPFNYYLYDAYGRQVYVRAEMKF